MKVTAIKVTAVKITAVIVSYNSDLGRLREILTALLPQCNLIIADNSDDAKKSAEIRSAAKDHGAAFLPMGGNKGIGAAQNAAIEQAFLQDAESVLLLDDDSIPDANLVAALLGCRSLGRESAAIYSATSLDAQGKNISHVRNISGTMARGREMRSSGTLISQEIFRRVGVVSQRFGLA